jgi:hypothetical protein
MHTVRILGNCSRKGRENGFRLFAVCQRASAILLRKVKFGIEHFLSMWLRGRIPIFTALQSSEDPEFCYPTAAEIEAQLTKVGFQICSVESLPPISIPSQRFTGGLTMIEARK